MSGTANEPKFTAIGDDRKEYTLDELKELGVKPVAVDASVETVDRYTFYLAVEKSKDVDGVQQFTDKLYSLTVFMRSHGDTETVQELKKMFEPYYNKPEAVLGTYNEIEDYYTHLVYCNPEMIPSMPANLGGWLINEK